MPRRHFAVLMRGINLGANNQVPMPAFRDALRDEGFDNVATLLQSGNVLLTSARTETEVAAAVEAIAMGRFGAKAPSIALSLGELKRAVDECPLTSRIADPKRMVALFTAKPIAKSHISAWDPCSIDADNIAVGHRVIYQWCPLDFRSAPNLLPRVEKRWAMLGTARNWTTTTKLLDLLTAM